MKKYYKYIVPLVVTLSIFTSCTSLTSAMGNMGDYMEATGVATDEESKFIANNLQLADAAAMKNQNLTGELEYKIGRVAASEMLKYNPIIRNEYVNKYLNEICGTLVLNSEKPYLFKGYFVVVVDSDEINAISTTGGHIFISKGLLDCVNSEDALAGIIAHELGHIQLNHGKEMIEVLRDYQYERKKIEANQSGLEVADKISEDINFAEKGMQTGDPFLAMLGIAADATTNALIKKGKEVTGEELEKVIQNYVEGYHPEEQEFDADLFALDLMSKAGYNPYALVDALYEIKRNYTNSGIGWEKTHPAPERRIKKADAYLRQHKLLGSDMLPREERFLEFKKQLN